MYTHAHTQPESPPATCQYNIRLRQTLIMSPTNRWLMRYENMIRSPVLKGVVPSDAIGAPSNCVITSPGSNTPPALATGLTHVTSTPRCSFCMHNVCVRRATRFSADYELCVPHKHISTLQGSNTPPALATGLTQVTSTPRCSFCTQRELDMKQRSDANKTCSTWSTAYCRRQRSNDTQANNAIGHALSKLALQLLPIADSTKIPLFKQ